MCDVRSCSTGSRPASDTSPSDTSHEPDLHATIEQRIFGVASDVSASLGCPRCVRAHSGRRDPQGSTPRFRRLLDPEPVEHKAPTVERWGSCSVERWGSCSSSHQGNDSAAPHLRMAGPGGSPLHSRGRRSMTTRALTCPLNTPTPVREIWPQLASGTLSSPSSRQPAPRLSRDQEGRSVKSAVLSEACRGHGTAQHNRGAHLSTRYPQSAPLQTPGSPAGLRVHT